MTGWYLGNMEDLPEITSFHKALVFFWKMHLKSDKYPFLHWASIVHNILVMAVIFALIVVNVFASSRQDNFAGKLSYDYLQISIHIWSAVTSLSLFYISQKRNHQYIPKASIEGPSSKAMTIASVLLILYSIAWMAMVFGLLVYNNLLIPQLQSCHLSLVSFFCVAAINAFSLFYIQPPNAIISFYIAFNCIVLAREFKIFHKNMSQELESHQPTLVNSTHKMLER